MPAPFFDRLNRYYDGVATVLRGEADAASIFPNTTDIGIAREQLYLKFLRAHLPSACNVNLGGFLFNQEGEESRQLDVIVNTDACPQFNFHNLDGCGKTFACVDGTLAVASVKSNLDSAQLREAVENIASIPQHRRDFDWERIGIANPFINWWPLKIIFACDGISADKLKTTMAEFNNPHPTIPQNRLPDIVHVAGKYCIEKAWRDLQHEGGTIKAGTYFTKTVDVDIAALAFVVERIQQLCLASRYIPYNYSTFVYRMLGMNPS